MRGALGPKERTTTPRNKFEVKKLSALFLFLLHHLARMKEGSGIEEFLYPFCQVTPILDLSVDYSLLNIFIRTENIWGERLTSLYGVG